MSTIDYEIKKPCENCKIMLPESKIQTHEAYCIRNCRKCPNCDIYVDKREVEEHNEEYHKKAICDKCGLILENQSQLQKHIDVFCLLRPRQCRYCEVNLPVQEFEQHEYNCGCRTKVCSLCKKNILMKDFDVHINSCLGVVKENSTHKNKIENKKPINPTQSSSSKNQTPSSINPSNEIKHSSNRSAQPTQLQPSALPGATQSQSNQDNAYKNQNVQDLLQKYEQKKAEDEKKTQLKQSTEVIKNQNNVGNQYLQKETQKRTIDNNILSSQNPLSNQQTSNLDYKLGSYQIKSQNPTSSNIDKYEKQTNQKDQQQTGAYSTQSYPLDMDKYGIKATTSHNQQQIPQQGIKNENLGIQYGNTGINKEFSYTTNTSSTPSYVSSYQMKQDDISKGDQSKKELDQYGINKQGYQTSTNQNLYNDKINSNLNSLYPSGAVDQQKQVRDYSKDINNNISSKGYQDDIKKTTYDFKMPEPSSQQTYSYTNTTALNTNNPTSQYDFKPTYSNIPSSSQNPQTSSYSYSSQFTASSQYPSTQSGYGSNQNALSSQKSPPYQYQPQSQNPSASQVPLSSQSPLNNQFQPYSQSTTTSSIPASQYQFNSSSQPSYGLPSTQSSSQYSYQPLNTGINSLAQANNLIADQSKNNQTSFTNNITGSIQSTQYDTNFGKNNYTDYKKNDDKQGLSSYQNISAQSTSNPYSINKGAEGSYKPTLPYQTTTTTQSKSPINNKQDKFDEDAELQKAIQQSLSQRLGSNIPTSYQQPQQSGQNSNKNVSSRSQNPTQQTASGLGMDHGDEELQKAIMESMKGAYSQNKSSGTQSQPKYGQYGNNDDVDEEMARAIMMSYQQK